MSSGAAFRTSVAEFVSSGAAFAAQSRRSSGNGFRSAASFLKTCTVYALHKAKAIQLHHKYAKSLFKPSFLSAFVICMTNTVSQKPHKDS